MKKNHQLVFDVLEIGNMYSREELATMWNYKTRDAIRRGVVTESETKNVVVFITEKKDAASTAYEDNFVGDKLHMQGQAQHGTDKKLSDPSSRVYLFYRSERKINNKSNAFVYYGEMKLLSSNLCQESPSNFVFRVDSLKEKI